MKFSNVEKQADGCWYVLKGTKAIFIKTKSETKEQALQWAAALSAKYYLQKANEALGKMNGGSEDYQRNMVSAYYLDVEYSMQEIMEHNAEFDHNDPYAWKA